MTIVRRLQNSSYMHQPKGKKQKKPLKRKIINYGTIIIPQLVKANHPTYCGNMQNHNS